MIDTTIEADLQDQLRDRLWRDDLIKMPRHLYPELSEAQLYDLWQRDYHALFSADLRSAPEMLALFAPATPADLQPRYLAAADGSWYAVIAPRYNLRTKYRFCYVRYWWATTASALQAMVQAVLLAWQTVSFDWLKLRLGYGSTLTPTDIHPRLVLQNLRCRRLPRPIHAPAKTNSVEVWVN